jgi:ribulose-phosphate 3-epimerase
MITIQSDSSNYVRRSLAEIKKRGIKAGLGVNPSVPTDQIAYYLPEADYVILLCVEPGLGGQDFSPYIYDRVATVRKMIEDSGRDVPIFVDGGVNEGTARKLLESGADVLIIGSGIFTGNDLDGDGIRGNIRKYKNL